MIDVFYNSQCSVDTDSFSPSSGKPRQVLKDWLLEFDLRLHKSNPVTLQDLELAHSASYVQGVHRGTTPNGFGNYDLAVAGSTLYTVGAMVDAACFAVTNKVVTCAPVSGFHHAGYFSAEGFCTFNGLVVAARKAQSIGCGRVAILDLDQHYGNGTQEIIDVLKLDIVQWSATPRLSEVKGWLEDLPSIIKNLVDGADLLLYQAGADSHVEDPLGGYLTTEEMRQRDSIVFNTINELKIPTAWNLAGGYQRDERGGIAKVLELHRNTMRECISTINRNV